VDIDLTQHARQSTVRLTTRGRKSGRPHTVTIWFVVTDAQHICVQHVRGPTADWYKNLLKEPMVHLDFGQGAVAARATAVANAEDIRRILALFRRKYLLSWFFQLLGMTRQAVAAELTVER
jgi:deazaflavin-dependent oxidoreductase (nitroreductase family)